MTRTAGAEARRVSVLMRRRIATSGRWSMPQWDLAQVVVDAGGEGATPVRRAGEELDLLWSGLEVELWRDMCEGYWVNLVSGKPRLFVACHVDPDAEAPESELVPAVVSASQEEAVAHLEADDEVYSAPMPASLVEWVERFVVAHYEPAQKKKRRRQDWRREGGGDGQRRPRAPRAD